MRRWKLFLIVVVLCAACSIGASCAFLDELKEDPEKVTQDLAAQAEPGVKIVEKLIPEPFTSIPRLILYGMVMAGTVWGTWNRTVGNNYKKLAVSTFRGVDEFKETAPREEVLKLIDALSARHDEANVRELVRTVRKADAVGS